MTPSPITAACQRLSDHATSIEAISPSAALAADMRAVVEAARRWTKVRPALAIFNGRNIMNKVISTDLIIENDEISLRGEYRTVEAFVDALPAPEEREGRQS